MHSAGDLSCQRGYEWWLMKEAKARNPDILIYGLPWAFPGWLKPSEANPNVLQNANATAHYIAAWVRCAEQTHGVHVDIVSVWNEQDSFFLSAAAAYIKTLRQTLDGMGYAGTPILGGDVHSWSICGMAASDTALASAVGMVGKHYPGTSTDPRCACLLYTSDAADE